MQAKLGTAFGFYISTANGQAVAAFTYRTEAEAKEAAEHVGSALGKAIKGIGLSVKTGCLPQTARGFVFLQPGEAFSRSVNFRIARIA